MGESERPAAVLTPKQREYLINGPAEDASKAAERALRARIRERIRAAVLDFSLILQALDEDEIEKAFDEDRDDVIYSVGSAVPSVIGVLYLADLDLELAEEAPEEGWHLSHVVEAGVHRALTQLEVEVEEISVDINIKRGEPFAELSDRDLSDLPTNTLKQMFFADAISNEEFVDAQLAKRKDRDNE